MRNRHYQDDEVRLKRIFFLSSLKRLNITFHSGVYRFVDHLIESNLVCSKQSLELIDQQVLEEFNKFNN